MADSETGIDSKMRSFGFIKSKKKTVLDKKIINRKRIMTIVPKIQIKESIKKNVAEYQS